MTPLLTDDDLYAIIPQFYEAVRFGNGSGDGIDGRNGDGKSPCAGIDPKYTAKGRSVYGNFENPGNSPVGFLISE